MICRSLSNIGNLSSLKLEFQTSLPSDCFKRIGDAISVLSKIKKLRLDFSMYKAYNKGQVLQKLTLSEL